MCGTLESAPGPIGIVLSLEENKVFEQLFRAADSHGEGIVTGDSAFRFFEKSGLGSAILGEIWSIADKEKRGFLTKSRFSIALRLIGYAQNGEQPRPELAQNPGPFPSFDRTDIPLSKKWTPQPHPPPARRPSPVSIAAPAVTDPGVNQVPLPTPQDVEGSKVLFETFGAVDGLMSGDVASMIFRWSELPRSTLGEIWKLTDRECRGALGPAEFVVAMHLITLFKEGVLASLPSVIPPALFEAAAGQGPARNNPYRKPAEGGHPTSTHSGPLIPPQRARSPDRSAPPVTQPGRRGSADGWAIEAAAEEDFDPINRAPDRQSRGHITMEEAAAFLSKYKLPGGVLARICDLADINGDGLLSREEFAVAMHLIYEQRRNLGPLPAELPAGLYPPSKRRQRQLFDLALSDDDLYLSKLERTGARAPLFDDDFAKGFADRPPASSTASGSGPSPASLYPPSAPQQRQPLGTALSDLFELEFQPPEQTPAPPPAPAAAAPIKTQGPLAYLPCRLPVPPGASGSKPKAPVGKPLPSKISTAPSPGSKKPVRFTSPSGIKGPSQPAPSKSTSEPSTPPNLSENVAPTLQQKSSAEASSHQAALDLHQKDLEITEQIRADAETYLPVEPPQRERVLEGRRKLSRFLIKAEERLNSAAAASSAYLPAKASRLEKIPEGCRKLARNFLGKTTGAEAGAGSDRHAKPENQPEISSRFKRYRTCSTCFETFPKYSTISAPCKHTYCSSCMKDFFTHATADEQLFPPRCCGKEIPQGVARKVLSVQQLSEFLAKSIEYTSADRTYCHVSSCSRFIPPAYITCDVGRCPGCSRQTCTMCKKSLHDGDCPNDENLAATLRLAATQGWKRCIRCRAVVMKVEGCNHVTCRCGMGMCYTCGAKYKSCFH